MLHEERGLGLRLRLRLRSRIRIRVRLYNRKPHTRPHPRSPNLDYGFEFSILIRRLGSYPPMALNSPRQQDSFNGSIAPAPERPSQRPSRDWSVRVPPKARGLFKQISSGPASRWPRATARPYPEPQGIACTAAPGAGPDRPGWIRPWIYDCTTFVMTYRYGMLCVVYRYRH